ncbi:hypothetical protein BH18ACI1_BH18ACI1_09710 [soil metagenome]|jgi:hypothetical protein
MQAKISLEIYDELFLGINLPKIDIKQLRNEDLWEKISTK